MTEQQLTLFDTMQYTGGPLHRAHQDDAGFDVGVVGHHSIQPGSTFKLPLAAQVKPPDHLWTLLVGRSSAFTRGLLINIGVIDTGYTGELFAVGFNYSNATVRVRDGERLVQLIPLPNITPGLATHLVQELPQTARGAKGFGSSGL